MTHLVKFLGLSLAISCLSINSFAQEQQSTSSAFSHTAYISLGAAYFDEDVALQEGIEDDGGTFRFAWMAQKDALLIGAGMGFYGYSDNEAFTQRVDPRYGRDYNADSDANGISAFGEVGYAFRANQVISLDAVAGFEAMIASDRSISYCSDCYSEDIDIDAGAYIEPRFRVKASSGFTFMLSYRQYLSGDVESAANMSFGWVFWDYL